MFAHPLPSYGSAEKFTTRSGRGMPRPRPNGNEKLTGTP